MKTTRRNERQTILIAGLCMTMASTVLAASPSNFLWKRIVGYIASPSTQPASVNHDHLTDLILMAGPTLLANGDLDESGVHSSLAEYVATGNLTDTETYVTIRSPSEAMSAATADSVARANLVSNIKDFAVANSLDGVNFDWEYPSGADINNYGLLLNELHAQLNPLGIKITSAVSYWMQDIPSWAWDSVDYIMPMCYDYFFPHSTYADMEATVNRWVDWGMPRNKIVVGVPFYGRRATGSTIGYNTIYDVYSPAPADDLVDNDTLYFNGIDTITAKAEYSKAYGGIMIFAVDYDKMNHPASLLTAIYKSFTSDLNAYVGVVTPTTVSFTGTAVEFFDNETHIIDGSAMSATPTVDNLDLVTHTYIGSDSAWVTDSPGADYFSSTDATVIFEFNLGATFNNIIAFVTWPYGGAGNDISEVVMYFSTDGGATTNSSQTVSVPLTDGSHAAIIPLTPVAANFITMAVTDNHYGGGIPGGDRVGLSEIRFVESPILKPSIISFSASPNRALSGDTVTLSWITDVENTPLTLDQGIGDVTGLTSTQVVFFAETTYTLTATNSEGTTNASVTVSERLPGEIIQPTAVVSEEFVFNSAINTINNLGMVTAVNEGDTLASALAAAHVFGSTYVGSYVSTARNGGADFYSADPSGVNIVYDLTSGGDTGLDTILMWNYESSGGVPASGGNQLRVAEVRVNTEAEGSAIFNGPATSITLKPTVDGDGDAGNDLGGVNSAQAFALDALRGRYVQLRLTDNYLGYQGITAGGDRVGFGEVRFESSPIVAEPVGNITITGPVSITGGQGMVLTWDTSNGQAYDVQYKSSLTNSSWTTFTNVTGNGSSISVTGAADNAETFYQVVTP